jgi:hypothetical protein
MINEHDIKDMCSLYELRKGDKFKLVPEDETGEPVKVPVAHPEFAFDTEYLFSHIDGMYSFCKDKDGQVVHFAAWTKVIKLGEKA